MYEEEKIKKTEYGKNRYLNMSEEKKDRIKNLKKNIAGQKSLSVTINKTIF